MNKRTRLFFVLAAGVLVVGLGTGLVASYMGLQGFAGFGAAGPAELDYVPQDVRLLARADVRAVMDSELRERVRQLEGHRGQDHPDRFLGETGIDIEHDVDSVLVSFDASDAMLEPRPLVLARGRFDEVRIEGLIRQRGGTVEDYKGERLVSHAESRMAVAFVEPGLAAVGTPAAVRRAIDTRLAGSGSVKDNAEVMRFVRDVDQGNAWAVARIEALTAAVPGDLAARLPAIRWFAASGYVNGGVRGSLLAETRDEASAQDLREVLRGFLALARLQAGQRAEFAGILNSFDLGGQGTTVSLGFSVPAEILDVLGALRAEQPAAPQEPVPGL